MAWYVNMLIGVTQNFLRNCLMDFAESKEQSGDISFSWTDWQDGKRSEMLFLLNGSEWKISQVSLFNKTIISIENKLQDVSIHIPNDGTHAYTVGAHRDVYKNLADLATLITERINRRLTHMDKYQDVFIGGQVRYWKQSGVNKEVEAFCFTRSNDNCNGLFNIDSITYLDAQIKRNHSFVNISFKEFKKQNWEKILLQ